MTRRHFPEIKIIYYQAFKLHFYRIRNPQSQIRNPLKSYLQLMRPANLITAFADILAGMAIAGLHFTTDNYLWGNAILLSISTVRSEERRVGKEC